MRRGGHHLLLALALLGVFPMSTSVHKHIWMWIATCTEWWCLWFVVVVVVCIYVCVYMCVCVCVCVPLQPLVATVTSRPGTPRRPVLRPSRPAATHPRVFRRGPGQPTLMTVSWPTKQDPGSSKATRGGGVFVQMYTCVCMHSVLVMLVFWCPVFCGCVCVRAWGQQTTKKMGK